MTLPPTEAADPLSALYPAHSGACNCRQRFERWLLETWMASVAEGGEPVILHWRCSRPQCGRAFTWDATPGAVRRLRLRAAHALAAGIDYESKPA